jgi:hypothetical protein
VEQLTLTANGLQAIDNKPRDFDGMWFCELAQRARRAWLPTRIARIVASVMRRAPRPCPEASTFQRSCGDEPMRNVPVEHPRRADQVGRGQHNGHLADPNALCLQRKVKVEPKRVVRTSNPSM